jgi:hypothetical protein
MTLKGSVDSDKLKLSMKTVQRIAFVVNLIGAGTLANVLLENINVKITLNRNGKAMVLAHEHLKLLAMESMFFQGFEHALSLTGISISATHKMLPLMVDLGLPLNLMGNDELVVEATTKSGWLADFDSDSFIDIEDREAIGVETVIPFIETKPVSATHARIVESLGNNVSSIMLLNMETARTDADADRVWESMIITSDKYNSSDNRGRLFSRRITQFEQVASAAARKQNFRFVPSVELDNVQITVELNGANVSATKNYIVYRSYLVTRDGLQRAGAMQDKHANRNQSKVAKQLNAA